MDSCLRIRASPSWSSHRTDDPRRSSRPLHIDASALSDRRRFWFVPTNTYYGEQEELTGKTPADFHVGRLLYKHIWDEKEWSAFYATCVYSLDQFLKHGLQKFEDNVLQEHQLLKVVYGDQILLDELTTFIEEVVKNGGEVSKEEVVDVYTYHLEFERFTGFKSNWKTTNFKNVCAGLGYRINLGREGNRWLKSVNGENKDLYQFVPQEAAVKGVLSTDAEEAAPEPPAPPLVENGRFSQSFLGDDLQEDG